MWPKGSQGSVVVSGAHCPADQWGACQPSGRFLDDADDGSAGRPRPYRRARAAGLPRSPRPGPPPSAGPPTGRPQPAARRALARAGAVRRRGQVASVPVAHQLAVRAATVDELDVIMQLLQQRIAWLRARGSDQWSTWPAWPAKLPAALKRRRVWLLTEDDLPVGTVTADEHADPDFWTETERADPAVYLAKLAVLPDRAGRGYGTLLLDVAGELAYREGRQLLRLDAWKNNPGLHAYYSNHGWRHLRTVDLPHRRSGALFETDARPLTSAQRQQVRWDQRP